jgi:putative flippase GtrA
METAHGWPRTLEPLARLLHRVRRGPGLFGQGLRFALTGGLVGCIYLTTTTVLSAVAGLPFQLALAVGFCTGMVVHFTLQRTFVWTGRGEFALSLHHQLGRYLVVAATQYGVTAASTSLLPAALGISTEAVYLATFAIVTCTNFLVFRHGVFHAGPDEIDPVKTVGAVPDPAMQEKAIGRVSADS